MHAESQGFPSFSSSVSLKSFREDRRTLHMLLKRSGLQVCVAEMVHAARQSSPLHPS
jgi:hypothetical protein